jgi:hypothetical protein
MSGASIAAEVAAALQEVAGDVGSNTFAVTLTQDSGEPANPWDTDTSTETVTNMAALIQNYPLGMIDGTLIRAEDRKVMLPATGPRPTTADKLTIAGKVYAIVSIMETSPSGVPLFYEVQARA